MSQDQEGWNRQLIRNLFNEVEQKAILSLPISSLGVGDRLTWKHTTHGQFSVKSGYKAAKEKQHWEKGSAGSSSSMEEERKLWDRIWTLNIKRKIQHFLWRACHNGLPVGSCLRRRGINVDGICRDCGDGFETVEHVFFQCPKAQLIWKLSLVGWDGLVHITDSFKGWWLEQGKAPQALAMQQRQELTAYIMWSMWKARNATRFKAESWPERDIIHKACEEWLEYKHAQPTEEVQIRRRCMRATPSRWQKPELG